MSDISNFLLYRKRPGTFPELHDVLDQIEKALRNITPSPSVAPTTVVNPPMFARGYGGGGGGGAVTIPEHNLLNGLQGGLDTPAGGERYHLPAPTLGGLAYGNTGPVWDALAAGTENYVLKMGADMPAWGQVDISEITGTHNLLSAYHGDTAVGTPVLGDLIYADVTPAWTKLAGDISNTRKFLRTLSVAGVAQAPAWDTITAADIASVQFWSRNAVSGYLYPTTLTDYVGVGTTTPGASLDVHQLASGTRGLLLSGTGVEAGSVNSDNGVILTIGHNSTGNRQLWLTDSARYGNASYNSFRYIVGFSIPMIDGISNDGLTRKNITFGYTDTNVGIGFPVTKSQSDITAKLHAVGTGLTTGYVFKLADSGFNVRFSVQDGGDTFIGTTDVDGTPPIGRLVVKGSTADGSTNIFVGRDSAEANVWAMNTDGWTGIGGTVADRFLLVRGSVVGRHTAGFVNATNGVGVALGGYVAAGPTESTVAYLTPYAADVPATTRFTQGLAICALEATPGAGYGWVMIGGVTQLNSAALSVTGHISLTGTGQLILGGTTNPGRLYDQDTSRTILQAHANVFALLTANGGSFLATWNTTAQTTYVHLYPSGNNTHLLGHSTLYWQNAYISTVNLRAGVTLASSAATMAELNHLRITYNTTYVTLSFI